MTPEEAEKIYGKKLFKKIEKLLEGCTIRVSPNGRIDIPIEDIENAISEINGEKIVSWD